MRTLKTLTSGQEVPIIVDQFGLIYDLNNNPLPWPDGSVGFGLHQASISGLHVIDVGPSPDGQMLALECNDAHRRALVAALRHHSPVRVTQSEHADPLGGMRDGRATWDDDDLVINLRGLPEIRLAIAACEVGIDVSALGCIAYVDQDGATFNLHWEPMPNPGL